MRTLSRLSVSIIFAASLVGCSSVSPNTWAKDFYAQANTAEILHLEGTNISITVSGASLIVLSTPVAPKTMIPRDPSVWEHIIDGAKTVAPWGVMAYLGANGSYTPTPTTIKGATTINVPAAPPAVTP